MNNTELIDKYLQGELTAEEKVAFENKLIWDTTLQEELEIQQKIMQGIEAAAIKQQFSNAIQKHRLTRIWIKAALFLLIATGLIFISYQINNKLSHLPNEQINLTDTITSGLKAEQFQIEADKDTIIETQSGVVFGIPAHAFGTNKKTVWLNIKTALSAADIIKAGLSTMSNNAMLQTTGMFYLNAFDGEKEISLLKNINVSIPTESINKKMMLFDGEQTGDGKINWVNPKPIENKLRVYDITKLNFYPERYLPLLKELKLNYTNKKYTDSLYFSLSGLKEQVLVDEVAQIEAKDYPVSDTSKPDSITYNHKYINYSYEIDPSRIKAIWNSKFNNTILATREFEERLKFIHTTCEPRYLDFYIKNLNKPLFEIDKLCATLDVGEGGEGVKSQFRKFVERMDGTVAINDGMQEKLSSYFQQKYTAYKNASEKTWEKYEAELNALNKIAETNKRVHAMDSVRINNINFEKEYCFNLVEAYRQIGVNRACKDTLPPPPANEYYNVIISTTGWKNLDMYVYDATQNRESMTYIDPGTGKTSTISYKEVQIKIINIETFDKVLVYLIPNQLSSFQQVAQKSNLFTENLNMLLKYDAVILAYKGTQQYFIKQSNLKPQLYNITLSAITDAGLKAALKDYPINKKTDFVSEAAYQMFQQKKSIRNLNLQSQLFLQRQVINVIFPCYKTDSKAPANISIPAKK